MVLLGAAHLEKDHDVDEGLRRLGHQVSTVEVHSARTIVAGLGTDLPDFILQAETGRVLTYKAHPGDPYLMAAMQGVALPWHNTEPVATVPQHASPPATPAKTGDRQGPRFSLATKRAPGSRTPFYFY